MQPEQHRTTLQIHLTFASGSRRAVVFELHVGRFFWRRETCAFIARRRGSFNGRSALTL